MKAAMKARLDAIQKGSTALKVVGGTALLAVGAAANAAAMDTTAIETALSEQNTAIQAVAGVVLGVLALIAAIGYIRRVIR